MSVGHYLDLPGARVIQTAELLLAGRCIRDLLAARAMGVLHGPAGSGKTFAAHVAVGELRAADRVGAVPEPAVDAAVARRLYRELAGTDPAARIASNSPRT